MPLLINYCKKKIKKKKKIQYLYLCKTGCPYVKNNYKINKSYTCKLQQEIYKDNAKLYKEDEYNEESVYMYLAKMHPIIADKYYPRDKQINTDEIPKLNDIINADLK